MTIQEQAEQLARKAHDALFGDSFADRKSNIDTILRETNLAALLEEVESLRRCWC